MKKIFITILLLLPHFFSLSQRSLVGTMEHGVESNAGSVFSYIPGENHVKTLANFSSIETGEWPMGGLMQADNGLLYGMTAFGGGNDFGAIFKIDPSNWEIQKTVDLNREMHGAHPLGTFIQAENGHLYGLVDLGGEYEKGMLLEYDLQSDKITNTFTFSGYLTGVRPKGNLVEADNGLLYGMTHGVSIPYFDGHGKVFSYDPDTNQLQIVFEFDGNNGSNPYGSLIKAQNGNLYGMTEKGGNNDSGVIFEFDPSSDSFNKIHDFYSPEGSRPMGNLIEAQPGVLFGLTSFGGTGNGVIFKFELSSMTYTNKFEFEFVNTGKNPRGTLAIASNGKLYGTTIQGGNHYDGVIFEYNPIDDIFTKKVDLENQTISFNLQMIEMCTTPTPIAKSEQRFCDYATISDIQIEGENISWYSEKTSEEILDPSTELINGKKYYALNTIENCQSTFRKEVTVYINKSTDVSVLPDTSACDFYLLPEIPRGNYFLQPNGMGNILNSGDTIHTTKKIYIYQDNGGCIDESSFTIDIIDLVQVVELDDMNACKFFILPAIEIGSYFTQSKGQGNRLEANDTIFSSQEIFIFNDEAVCSDETSSFIEINQSVSVDALESSSSCDFFVLPAINNGSYFTQSKGQGNKLEANDTIFSSQEIFIFNDEAVCSDETSSFIEINQSVSVDALENSSSCDFFVLPAINNGSYFTQSKGQGNRLEANDTIFSSQEIFIFNDEAVCSDETSSFIEINQSVSVDALESSSSCDFFVLPAINNGSYFTQSKGQGNKLEANDTIFSSQEIFIFNDEAVCSDETSSFIEINQSVSVDALENSSSCDFFVLPAINNGSYFTQSKGQGNKLEANDTIFSSQEIFIFNDEAVCSDETSSFIEINRSVSVDALESSSSCDFFVLPAINNGSYFTQSKGQGNKLEANDTIFSSQEIFIFNDEAVCSDETSSFIEINRSVSVDALESSSSCDFFVLPAINNGSYFTQSKGQGNRLEANDTIFSSQEIFIFNDEAVCSDETSSFIEINQSVSVDALESSSSCDFFVLPAINNGSYFTQSKGQGNKLEANDTIFSSKTLYIYDNNASCSSETEFNIEIETMIKPSISVFGDSLVIDNYNSDLSYQWFISDGSTINKIDNETNEFYKPNMEGTYMVTSTLSNGDCYSTSEHFEYHILSNSFKPKNNISVIPNPSRGAFRIDFKKANIEYKIIDSYGKIVKSGVSKGSKLTVEMDSQSGVYFIVSKMGVNKIIIK